MKQIKLIECPRDAMQGWSRFINTADKIEYINALLRVGFDTIDAGSFVSPKAIPQMADTAEVFSGLELEGTNTKLLAIVANTRGAETAALQEKITYLGFPFSVSRTFQLKNTNSTMEDSLQRVSEIQQICLAHNKQLVVYISMGFGNPYGDPYSEQLVAEWVDKIVALGVKIISLADTVGLASPEQVASVVRTVIKHYPAIETGVHLHSTHDSWEQKLTAAVDAGCIRFDGALKGIGGCPMAGSELVGNMDTSLMIPYFSKTGYLGHLDLNALQICNAMADKIFR